LVRLEPALVAGLGKERLRGILCVFGGQLPLHPQVLVDRLPVTDRELVERLLPRRRVGAPQPLQHGMARRRKDGHGESLTPLPYLLRIRPNGLYTDGPGTRNLSGMDKAIATQLANIEKRTGKTL